MSQQTATSNNSDINPDALAHYKQESARLQTRREELEAERQKLLRGQLTKRNQDGSTVEVFVGGFPADAQGDVETIQEQPVVSGLQPLELIEQEQLAVLAENPVVVAIYQGFQSKNELREEMTLAGELPDYSAVSPVSKAVLANRRINVQVARKNKTLAKFISSPWLLGVGLVAFIFWLGGPFLYTMSGGVIGGKPGPVTISPTIRPVASPTVLFTSPSPSPDSSKTSKTGTSSAVSDANSQLTMDGRGKGETELITFKYNSANLPGLITDASSTDTTPVTSQATVSASVIAKSPIATTTPPASTPTPTATPSGSRKEPGREEGQDQPRVGQLPSAAGGNNGPHGAFSAPTRLVVPSLNLDVLIEEALFQEQPGSPGQLGVIWPRPKQNDHFGAYPGEIGTGFILSNQVSLGALRRVALGSQIILYNQQGQPFTYKVLPFSPQGLAEREIDLSQDGWIFEPNNQTSILTIIVNSPQPLPPVNPGSEGEGNGSSSGQIPATKDDYTNPKKLAYRAALVTAPTTTITPSGLPVEVPEAVYTVPTSLPSTAPALPSASLPPAISITPTAATGTPTPTPPGLPAAGATPSPTIVIPNGPPNTGGGGGD